MTPRLQAVRSAEDIPLCLTVRDVASRLCVSESTVYQLCEMGEENGGLHAFRIRTCRGRTKGAIRIPIEAVTRYLGRSSVRGDAASRIR